jgi:hypothetical protein
MYHSVRDSKGDEAASTLTSIAAKKLMAAEKNVTPTVLLGLSAERHLGESFESGDVGFLLQTDGKICVTKDPRWV